MSQTITATTTTNTSFTPQMHHPRQMRLRKHQQQNRNDNVDDSIPSSGKTAHYRGSTDGDRLNYHKYDYSYDNSINHTETQSLTIEPSKSGSNDSNDEYLNADIPAQISPRNRPMEELSRVLIFGFDISHFPRKLQFITCASGVFMFSLLYGYLQELLSVKLCNRQLGLFVAMVQFMGYAVWSKFLNAHVQRKHSDHSSQTKNKGGDVPARYYILLAVLRAIDASMTNMAMAYVNYPAKVLMKSSRVVFTMLFSTIISQKRYMLTDYLIVILMVSGLVIFMHADSQSSAVFQPLGIIMLTISLCCDAVLTNLSEKIMKQYNVGQDQFIFKLYSFALVGIICAATLRGDLFEGTRYLMTPGTYNEIMEGKDPSWTVQWKVIVIVLFSSTGFLGSSCSALITKEFGALTMSITSTARKATSLFLSFALFNNVCTTEHIEGIILFIAALVAKSVRATRHGYTRVGSTKKEDSRHEATHMELGTQILSESFHHNDRVTKRRNRTIGDIV